MGRIMVCVARRFGRSIRYLVVGLGYVLLTLAELPVCISSGGWSFFRFDEQESVTLDNVCNVLLPNKANALLYSGRRISYILAVWWPLFQIFCFFKYSRFSCVSTWTVLTNGSKLIRSDWFSSNIYLLVLGPIIPFCSISAYPQQFFYFMAHLQQTQSFHKVCVLHQCVYDLCLC